MKKLTSYTVAAIAAVFLLLTITGEAHGGNASSSIQVQATVGHELEYNILCNGAPCPDSSDTWEITQPDLDLGYKTVDPGTIVSVTTNDPNGYIIRVCSTPDPTVEGTYIIKYIELTMTESPLFLKLSHPGCEDIPMPNQGEEVVSELNYKFYLRHSADPGTYMWPISVLVIPF